MKKESFIRGGHSAEGAFESADAIQCLGFAAGVDKPVRLVTDKEIPFDLFADGQALAYLILNFCCLRFHGLFFSRAFGFLSLALHPEKPAKQGGAAGVVFRGHRRFLPPAKAGW
jgi:hypothetical protein